MHHSSRWATVCASIHNRMPVILERGNYAAWLGELRAECDALLAMLKPYSAEAMQAYPASSAVGHVKNNEPPVVEPLAV